MSDQVTKTRLAFIIQQKVYLLNISVQVDLESSRSFVLALASFMAYVAKIYPESILLSFLKEKTQKGDFATSWKKLREPSHYFQIWCDYIFQMICADNIMMMGSEVLILSPASEQYLPYILKSGFFMEPRKLKKRENFKQEIAKQIYGQEWQSVPEEKIRKIVIINNSASVTNVDKTKAKINVNGLFSGLFYRHGDRWKAYEILNNQVPTVEELVAADTVLVSGSTYSVNNMHPYMRTLCDNLKLALAMNQKLKMIGFCFGHQLLANLHGATIETRSQVRGLQSISVLPHNLGEISYLEDLYSTDSFKMKIYQFHSDFVVTVPEGFSCIGESDSCSTEMLVSNDKRIFTFQFHPEYLVEYIRVMEKRWLSLDKNTSVVHQDKYAADSEHHATVEVMCRAIRKFMDYQVCC